MFSIKNLTHLYQQKTVLKVADWEGNQAEQWLLLGNSGSGKTTLLHILGALLKPSSGEVEVCNQHISSQKSGNLDKFRAMNVGFIFQKPHLIQSLSVLQNLLAAQYASGFNQDRAKCQQILERLDVHTRKHAFPSQLSQGESQRVSVARALLNNPKIILADEPTASLDDKNATRVIALLKEQAQQQGATLVIATHDSRVKELFDKQFVLGS
jgi:putative ABC transport system ATP-binding protein